MAVTIKQLRDILKQLTTRQFQSKLDERVDVGLETFRAAMLGRIHNEGRAANETLIGVPPVVSEPSKRLGAYSRQHAKKRRKTGRQIKTKDLELTGRLRRSVLRGKRDGKNAIYFKDAQSGTIAAGQEQQTKKEIWSPTDTEREELLEIITDDIVSEILEGLRR